MCWEHRRPLTTTAALSERIRTLPLNVKPNFDLQRGFSGLGGLDAGPDRAAGLAKAWAVPQSPRGDVCPIHRESVHEFAQDDGAGGDDVGPSPAHAGEVS